MVEKLSVQIALEGGAEIERQLKDIGDAGQEAFAQIEKSATQVGGFKNLKPEEVTKTFEDLGIKGTAAFDKIQQAVASAGNFEKLVVGVQSVETGFAVLGRAALPVIGGLIAGATAIATAWLGVAKSINEVDAAAAKLGISFQQFDKLRQGFLQAGISSEAVTAGLQKLKSQLDQMDVERVKKAFNELADAATRGFGAQGTAQLKLLQQAAEGVGPAAEAARKALVDLGQVPVGEQLGKVTEEFKRLGIQGTTLSEVLPQIIAKLQAMPDSVERTNLAITLLGDKLGVELVAALRTGSLTAGQFNAAMGNLTREQQIAAAQTQQSINRMNTAWDDFKANVISPIAIPLFDFMKGELDEIKNRIATTKQEWAALQSALSAVTPKTTIDISLTQSLAPEIDKINQKLAETEQKAAAANQALAQTGQAGAQAGQQAAAGLQLVANPLTGMPEVINTTNQALASIGPTGTTSFEQVTTATQTSNSTLSTFASTLAGWNWDPIAAGVRVWNDITAAIQGAIDRLLQYLGLQSRTPAPAPKAAGGGQFARGGLLGGRGSGTSDSNLAWLSRGEFVINAAAVRHFGANFFAALNARKAPRFAAGGLVDGGFQIPIAGVVFPGGAGDKTLLAIEQNTEVLTKLVQTVDGLVRKFDETFTKLSQKLDERFDNLDQKIDGLIQTVSGLSQQIAALAQAISQKSGKALGGLLGGRGSGTSDSNLAWVSRGEHIMPAHTVAQPGVLAFLEALRHSGGNLRGVLDGMGRFALGGMIRGPMPAFASGGLAGGMSNVTIQFPGLPAIGGLRASSDVVEQLHRAAALAQVRSGGRKPSRYS